MSREGFVGNFQEALNCYSRHILEMGSAARRCQQPPTVSSLKNVLENKSPCGSLFLLNKKKRKENRAVREFSSMRFPSLAISNVVFDSNHTWRVHPQARVCVCVCITDLFITVTTPAWRQFSSSLLHLTCSAQHQNLLSNPPVCIQVSDLLLQSGQLSMTRKPQESRAVIGAGAANRQSTHSHYAANIKTDSVGLFCSTIRCMCLLQ